MFLLLEGSLVELVLQNSSNCKLKVQKKQRYSWVHLGLRWWYVCLFNCDFDVWYRHIIYLYLSIWNFGLYFIYITFYGYRLSCVFIWTIEVDVSGIVSANWVMICYRTVLNHPFENLLPVSTAGHTRLELEDGISFPTWKSWKIFVQASECFKKSGGR